MKEMLQLVDDLALLVDNKEGFQKMLEKLYEIAEKNRNADLLKKIRVHMEYKHDI